MEENSAIASTPGGNQSTVVLYDACRPSDSGEPAPTCLEVSETPLKIKHRAKNFFASFNANSLQKVGKLKQLTDTLSEHRILIAAIQETRFTDEQVFESEGYRIFKGKPGKRVIQTIPHLGTGFVVNKKILDSIINFTSTNSRISTLSFRSMNKVYTIVNVHAPTNQANKRDPEGTDRFWEEIEDIMSKVPDKNTIILLGDFNAQIGKERKFQNIVGNYPAHRRTNRNGERLIELCKAFNLVMKSTAFKHLPRKQKTWKSPNPNLGEFQIDHVAIARKAQREIQNVKVLRSAKLDSDHYLSKIKMKLLPRNTKRIRTPRIERFDTEKLRSNNEFTLKLQSMDAQNWEQLREMLVEAAKDTAQLTKPKKHAWWNNECDTAVSQRQLAWQKWNSLKNQANWTNFLNERKCAARTIRSVKRAFDKHRLAQIEQDFKKNNTRDFYRTFKSNLRKYSPPSLQFRDCNGKLAYSNKENCQILAKYFETLLNCKAPCSKFTFEDSAKVHSDSSPPTKEEISQIIRSLKNNKAPGEDSIIAELWKFASDNAVDRLKDIIHEIWDTERLPSDWTSALIHPLHKKGDKADVSNYRGISLLPITYKILSKALQTRAEEQLDPELGDYQGGFRKGRSCVEQIMNLRSVLSYLKLRSKKFVVTFVDFKKAYDSVDRTTLLQILQEFGLDNKTRAIIQQTLSNTTSKVKFRGEISHAFEIKTGVRQGDGLSPLLFNCVLEKVIREWRKELSSEGVQSGVRLGCKSKNLSVDCLAFADDLAIFADSLDTAVKQINQLQSQAEKAGLQISFEKTEFITNIKPAPRQLEVNQGIIKRVDKFKYLGEWIEPNMSEKAAFASRMNKMEMAYHLTRNVYNKKSVSLNAKLKHYCTVIRPEALYAAECLVMNKKGTLEKLETKERKILRKILGPIKENGEYRRRHNRELYTHIEKLTDVMRKRRITFYGHVARMNPARLTSRIFTFLEEKKTKGAWFSEVQKDLQEIGISNEDIQRRGPLKKKLQEHQSFQPKPKLKTGKAWTEERKEQHRLRMKEYWANIKAQKKQLK